MIKLEEISKLSEKELTIQIVIPLLKKMGFRSVTYTGGTREFGRDVVFYVVDAFGIKKWKGAQVKIEKIHGTSSKKGNIQEIINQIQESFDNPYLHPTYGEIPTNEIYIITSNKITSKAKRAIKNKFKQKPVYFVDGQELINMIEEYLPDIMDKINKSKAIKNRIQELLTSDIIMDIRELNNWFFEKEILELDEQSMNFISSQIFAYFFKNTSLVFEERFGKTNWEILSWLEDLDNSERLLSKEIKEFLENFPYYSMFAAPNLIFSFLKSLNKLKEISPETYSKLKIDTYQFFRVIKKSLDTLDYPNSRYILCYILEECDALAAFYDGKQIDLPEEFIFPTLIGMRAYSAAKPFLEKNKTPQQLFDKYFRFCVNSGLTSYHTSESNIVIKFSEFLSKSKLGSKLLIEVPFNYRILLLWGMGNGKEAMELLGLNETFKPIEFSYGEKYLPYAYRFFLGKPEDFFMKIANVKIPEIPEIYYELSELKAEIGDFEGALKMIDIALNNSAKLKRDWLLKFMEQHKASCLFNIKQYSKCLALLEKMISEYGKTDFALYEKCKKVLKNEI